MRYSVVFIHVLSVVNRFCWQIIIRVLEIFELLVYAAEGGFFAE
jgi:hypothetical protein